GRGCSGALYGAGGTPRADGASCLPTGPPQPARCPGRIPGDVPGVVPQGWLGPQDRFRCLLASRGRSSGRREGQGGRGPAEGLRVAGCGDESRGLRTRGGPTRVLAGTP